MYVSLKMIDVSRHFLADPCIYIIQVVRSSTSLALINPALINNQVTDFFFLARSISRNTPTYVLHSES